MPDDSAAFEGAPQLKSNKILPPRSECSIASRIWDGLYVDGDWETQFFGGDYVCRLSQRRSHFGQYPLNTSRSRGSLTSSQVCSVAANATVSSKKMRKNACTFVLHPPSQGISPAHWAELKSLPTQPPTNT